MKRILTLALYLALACATRAASLTNLASFTEITKPKGALAVMDGRYYFACESGGAYLYGYIGRYDPATGVLQNLYDFPVQTKPKGGLVPVGTNELWFVCEKGGATTFGYLGSFKLSDSTVTSLHDFPVDTKPKTAPVLIDTNWYFFTEAGGAYGGGYLARYTPGAGVSIAASFHAGIGYKFETPPVLFNGVLYYAAREGGDFTQAGGKGAGTIGRIDLATATAVKLLDLHATNHGAKIRHMIPYMGRLFFTAEEGGDLALNAGKGWGAISSFDPATTSITRHVVFDDLTNGRKPRSLLPVDDKLYFNCPEGGSTVYGTLGYLDPSLVAQIVATNNLEDGYKAEALVRDGSRLLFTSEFGCAGFNGGITAYELPQSAAVPPPAPAMAIAGGQLNLNWSSSASDFMLEFATTITGTWTTVAGPGVTNAAVPLADACGFFRLRQE